MNAYGENRCFVSYSGGKDSTVLLHLIHRIYPDIPAIFVDTGLEYPEVRRMAIANADIVLKPKMKFRDVISEYGYPVISKGTSECVHKFKVTRSDFMMRKLLYGIQRDGRIGRLRIIPKKHIPLIYAPYGDIVSMAVAIRRGRREMAPDQGGTWDVEGARLYRGVV